MQKAKTEMATILQTHNCQKIRRLFCFPYRITMDRTIAVPSKKTIILVGLGGCFLTSLAGVSGVMLMAGWEASGGWVEWAKRLGVGYPCACLVVLSVFPYLVPRLTAYLEAKRGI